MQVAYFVHNLNDAAVAKRVLMLKAAGMRVTLLGFRRQSQAICESPDVEIVELGKTADAKLIARAACVALNMARAPIWAAKAAGADIIIARNLETLVLAAIAKQLSAPRARLIYECLDIHRLMLRTDLLGRCLRGLERQLLARSDGLIVSSPAFVTHYFKANQAAVLPAVALVENKILRLSGEVSPPLLQEPPGPPWRIGWFGLIRCRRSLDLLTDLAKRRPDLVQVELRGRPSYSEFEDFDGQVSALPNVVFGGPYQPDELAGLYGGVHLNWTIDSFQAEGNSHWLLPNRLYEGGYFGIPPIAARNTETGRWLSARGLGLLVDNPERDLERLLETLTPERYRALAQLHRSTPLRHFVFDRKDCLDLAVQLAGPEPDTQATPISKVFVRPTSPGTSATPPL